MLSYCITNDHNLPTTYRYPPAKFLQKGHYHTTMPKIRPEPLKQVLHDSKISVNFNSRRGQACLENQKLEYEINRRNRSRDQLFLHVQKRNWFSIFKSFSTLVKAKGEKKLISLEDKLTQANDGGRE